MIDEIRAEVENAGTEIAEKNAVSKWLRARGHRKKPETTQGKTADGRSVRMYLWSSTPAGNFVLISGPDIDGYLLEVFPHTRGKGGTVYFPATKDRPALSDVRRNPAAQLPMFEGFPVLHFASGTNQPGEIRGFAEIGKPIGASFGRPNKSGKWKRDCTPECIDELIHAMGLGVPIFLDSGAYSEFTSGGKSPITPKQWEERLDVYEQLADAGGPLANVVAPDKVGDQTESFKRLRKHAPQIRRLINKGATVLVPLQQGAMNLDQAHKEATKILKTDRWTPALPFKQAATSFGDLRAYLGSVRPRRVHLLGMGPGSPGAKKAVFAIKSVAPGTQLQMDSGVIRSQVGRAQGIRPLTRAQDEAREQVRYERYVGGSPEGARTFDITEAGPDMLSAAALRRIAKFAGLSPSETKKLVASPESYFQSNGDDPFYLRAGPAIDEEMAKALSKAESYETKRRAIRTSLKDLSESQRFISNPSSYPFLSLETVEMAVPAMEDQGVSEVARSSRGFLSAFKRAKGDPSRLATMTDRHSGQNWADRRNNFIARHRAQMESSGWENGEPTRRHLALVAWAYSPSPKRFEKWARAQARTNPAPGYKSWSWTQEDWRSIEVHKNGRIDFESKCGADGTQDHSGRPHLCLPLKAIESLMRTDKGRSELRKQARAKAKAPKGERVPYLPMVKKAVATATKDTPKDKPARKRNPETGEGGTAIVRGGPSGPVRFLEKRGFIRSPVLDFGSGHGEDAEWLRSKGYTVREYDPNFEGVDKMPTGTYNTVLVTYVLNVLPKAQEKKIVRQVNARLRPNGTAFFAVRGDVKKAGKTAKGYQRPVKMGLPIAGRPNGSPIFVEDKSAKQNPRSVVGKIREDSEGNKYVLWRPVLSDGSRPRIHLSADEPMDAELVDAIEAKEQLKVARKIVEKREKEDRKKGILGFWKRGTGRKIAVSKGSPQARTLKRAATTVPLFDSEGDEYRATYKVFATDIDGMGPLLASNLPDTFEPTPGYPTVFQARTLQREGEKNKIRKIARNLDPDRLLLHHSDPTFGTPVVWEGDGKQHKVGTKTLETPKGKYYVLGGNGRLMAILMAPTDRFQSYVQTGRSLWPDLWPSGSAPDGERRVLVRIATKKNGDKLTFSEARKLAGRTQQSPAGEQSPIGKSLSLIRSLGLEQVSDLPQFQWDRLITQDNVTEFMDRNDGYTRAVLSSMGKARAESYQQDDALMAQLFNDLMVGYLPKRFHLRGFVGEKQERALLTALPILVAIHQAVETGDVLPKWDLFPLLDGAERFAQLTKTLSNRAAINYVELAAAQVQLGEGTEIEQKFQSLFDDLPLLAVLFGLVLKKGEKARDPAITISELLIPYANEALGTGDEADQKERGARQTGMLSAIAGQYGEPDESVDPAEFLAEKLKVQLPKAVRADSAPLFERVANPRGFQRTHELTDDERRILASLENYTRVWHAPLPAALRNLFRLRYARVPRTFAASKTVTGRRVYDIQITERGRRALEGARFEDQLDVAMRQQRMFNPSDPVPPIPPRYPKASDNYEDGSRITKREAWHQKYGDPGDKFDVGDQLNVGHPSGVRLYSDSLSAWLTDRTFLGMNRSGVADYRKLIEGQEYTFRPDGGRVTGSRKKQGRTTLTVPGFDWDRFGFTGRGAFDRAVAFARSYEWGHRSEPAFVDWNIIGIENQEGSGFAVRPPLLKSKAQDSTHYTLMDKTQPGKIAAITLESLDAPVTAQTRLLNPDDDDDEDEIDRTIIEESDWEDDEGDAGIDALPKRGEQIGLFGGVEFTSEALSPPGRLVVLNMGLGRDSISMLCLLAKNQLMVDGKFLGPKDVDAVVFSDTGAEWKHTMNLIPRVEEFSRKNGIRFIWLQKPVPGTETGRLLDDWLETQIRNRTEREQGWEQVYQEKVAPLYAQKDIEADALRADRDKEVDGKEKELQEQGLSKSEIRTALKPVREKWAKIIKNHRSRYTRLVDKWKREGGFKYKAERAWWAPQAPQRRAKYDTIEARAAAGVYHLRPEILVDFGWKGTIPLRSDKSCTGNHKVAPIRKVTEDLAIEKFGPWAVNRSWGNAVKQGKREPHLNLIGLAADETDRLEKGGDVGCFTARYVTEAYPLAEMGIGKSDEQPILDACGFGDVRKSGCWMCPYQPTGWWWALSELQPDLFARAVAAEAESTRRDPKLFFVGSAKGKRSEEKDQEIAKSRQRRDRALVDLRDKKKLAIERERKTAKAAGVPASQYKTDIAKIRATFDASMKATREKAKVEQSEIRAKYKAMGAPLLPEAVADWRAAHPDADAADVLNKQYAKCAIKFPQKKNPALPEPGCCPECDRFVSLWLQFGIPNTLDRVETRQNPVSRFQQSLFGTASLPGSGTNAENPVLAYGRIWDRIWTDEQERGNPTAKLVTAKAGRRLKQPRKEMDVLSLPPRAQSALFGFTPSLDYWDLIIVNSSGGKDSLAILDMIAKMARAQGVTGRVRVVHADLGEAEHEGVTDLVRRQAAAVGLPVDILEPSEGGVKKYLFERFRKRAEQMAERGQTGKGFPGFGTRYCTSEFKTSEVSKWFKRYLTEQFGGGDLLKKYGRRARVLNILGMRAEESADRAKVKGLAQENETKTRWVEDRWLPIQGWSESEVWEAIKESGLEYHPAYEAGFKRLSCRLCPLASREDVALASLVYPETTQRIIDIEDQTGALFHQEKTSLRDIREWAENEPTLQQLAKQAKRVLEKSQGRLRRIANPGGHHCQFCEARKVLDEAAPRLRRNVSQLRMFPSLTKEQTKTDLFPEGAQTPFQTLIDRGVPDTLERFLQTTNTIRSELTEVAEGAALDSFLVPAFLYNLRYVHGIDSQYLARSPNLRQAVFAALPESKERAVAAARREIQGPKAVTDQSEAIDSIEAQTKIGPWFVEAKKQSRFGSPKWEVEAYLQPPGGFKGALNKQFRTPKGAPRKDKDKKQIHHEALMMDIFGSPGRFIEWLSDKTMQQVYGTRPAYWLDPRSSSGHGTKREALTSIASLPEYGRMGMLRLAFRWMPRIPEIPEATAAAKERYYFQQTDVVRAAAADEQRVKSAQRKNREAARLLFEKSTELVEALKSGFDVKPWGPSQDRLHASGGPATVPQLKKMLPENWSVNASSDCVTIESKDSDVRFTSCRGKRKEQIQTAFQEALFLAQKTESEIYEYITSRHGRSHGLRVFMPETMRGERIQPSPFRN